MLPGNYIFEVFGGQGGDRDENEGGYGGHSVAHVQIPSSIPIYLYVGSRGTFNCKKYIFGGGGYANLACGGGASDFRIDPLKLSSRILIAGGGGGAGTSSLGGHGGGLMGLNTNSKPGDANQKTGYSFGLGYSGSNSGGGGGLYGGDDYEGGSGFVYSPNKESKEIDTIDAVTVIDGYTESGINRGYGYAIITRESNLNRIIRLMNTKELSSDGLRLLQIAALHSYIDT